MVQNNQKTIYENCEKQPSQKMFSNQFSEIF
jgi:hypothetical protein